MGDHPRIPPPMTLTPEQSAFFRQLGEAALARRPVPGRDPADTSRTRDLADCGTNLCWGIAAAGAVCAHLRIKGASEEVIKLNIHKLIHCYEEDGPNYPAIIKKAFKYAVENGTSTDHFYPPECSKYVPLEETPEEVNALRISGFEILDHKDEEVLMSAMMKGPIVGAVRQSPEFATLGKKIYKGSDNEYVIGGKGLNHAMLMCGYGTSKEGGKKKSRKKGKNYWNVQNSLGTSWGAAGYGKIARDSSLPEHKKHLITCAMHPTFE